MRFAKIIIPIIQLLFLGCNQGDNHAKNIIPKSLFDGEWYTRAVLVEKNSHSSLAFTGLECPLERIKFEITKDKLLAYRSYNENDAQLTRDKYLVAAFKINKHVSEDFAIGKSWQKRESIDVDWSKNLVPHLECNAWLDSITQVYIDNSDDKTAEYTMKAEEDYIETTVNALVMPNEETCNSFADQTCVGAQYRVKFSFRKISPSDYEPRHYPDYEAIRYGKNDGDYCLDGQEGCQNSKDLWLYSDAQQFRICDPLKDAIAECFQPKIKMNAQFGFFRTEIDHYDSRYDLNRGQRHQLINRWNIWQNTRDEKGSSIPLAERVPKKISYYLSAGFPKDLLPAIQRVSAAWNIALANVVAKLKDRCTSSNIEKTYLAMNKEHEVLKNYGHRSRKETCEMLFEETKNGPLSEIFFSGRPEEIIEVFGTIFEIRENDCNIENVKNYARRNAIGPLVNDPTFILSDDTVSYACNWLQEESTRRGLEPFVWQQLGDLRYSFVNGVKKPEDAGLLGYGPAAVDPLSGEIVAANANIYLAAITEYADSSVRLLERVEKLEKTSPKKIPIKDMSSDFDAHLPLLRPAINAFQRENLAKLISSPVIAHLNVESLKNAHQQLDQFGVNNLIDIFATKAQLQKKSNDMKKAQFFSERSACFMHTGLDFPFVRLRKDLKNRDVKDKVALLQLQIVEGVLLHEIGHTLGLRHNFKGTNDALNYPPNFWGYDSKDYRARPGLSEEELRSSSIMDYHQNFNSDFSGLGPYDYAALLFGYGEKVEVFDDEDGFVPHALLSRLPLMHYRDLPYLFSGNGAEEKITSLIQETKEKYRRGDRSARLQIENLSLPSRAENLYKRRYINFEDLRSHYFAKYFAKSKSTLAPVPYSFCTDQEISDADLFCHPFIFGASASEVVNDAIDEYATSRLMRKSKLKEQTNVYQYLNHLYRRVYRPILRAYQYQYAFNNDDYAIYPMVYDLKQATKAGLNLISEVVQNVEPGIYCRDEEGNYIPKTDDKCDEPISIGHDLGEEYHSSFTDDVEGRHKNIGFIYDKILALLALIDDHAELKHEFAYWQEQNFSIGFSRSFPKPLFTIFSSIYRDQWQEIAARVSVNPDQQAVLHYQDLFSKHEEVSTAPKIKPSMSTIFKDYAILFSLLGLSNSEDHQIDFAESSHIALLHNDLPLREKDSISFEDPYTGFKYRAAINKEDSLGYLLVKDASEMVKSGPWYMAKQKVTELNTRMSSMHLLTSAETITPDELAEAEENFQRQDEKLKEKIRVIEMVRRLSNKVRR